ncbi:MAG TPA: M36 family metallopeptidase [Acidimicrobiales bacterium]|nr:M36 family metallopeptidase [Acidimicrobiales bacterium]
MSREVDVRNFSASRATPERIEALSRAADEVSNALPGSHQVRITKVDPTTGNAAVVESIAAPAPAAGAHDYIRRALEHVQAVAPAFGLVDQAPEYVADPTVLTTSSGARAVNLQQRYKGIPIFQAGTTVRFAPGGSLIDAVGSPIGVGVDTGAAPAISVTDAVVRAAQQVATPADDEIGAVDQFGEPLPQPTVDIEGFAPMVRASFTNQPDRPTTFAPGPFGGEIRAQLMWFPLDDLRLAWNVDLVMPGRAGQYVTLVDANSGDILYCKQVMNTVAATGNVYRVDPGTPRQMTDFPRPLGDHGLPLPLNGQKNWRWCHKCQGLFFAGNPGSKCPAGGAHENVGSGDYGLALNSPGFPGQHNWRWCHKCQGLYFAGNPGSHCPAGGAHENQGSGDYALQNQQPLAFGQHGWRWCKKCQGLYFAGNAGSKCPVGGAHDATGSGDYTLSTLASGVPKGFPETWVASTKASGNSTEAHLGPGGPTITGTTLNGKLTFDPADATGDDQKVLNIFYFCAYMHDLSYLLHFREADGNFQKDNFGRGGLANDPVNAVSHPGPVYGTANMDGRAPEGTAPEMNMGLVSSTNRHTAFDSTVVFHEFTHGISGRLCGGPMDSHSLESPQSGGMGEGWSDYIACTINNVVVLGNWVLNNTGGIRKFPYDSNFPDGFGALGTGRYTEVHNIGEIWCATLMEINRRTAKHFALQLVIDSLKLMASNPSFLDARDAMFTALNAMKTAGQINENQRAGAWQGLWSAFVKFGMGPQAASNGAQLSGIVADSSLGQRNWRWCHKCQGLFFAGNPGSKCPAGGAHDNAGSANYDIVMNMASAPGQDNWRWCHKCQGMYFAGNPGSHCPAGGAHDKQGSGDYKLIFNAWGSPAQNNWRSCHKCQGLYFAGNSGSKCPTGGAHDNAGSGDYVLMFT